MAEDWVREAEANSAEVRKAERKNFQQIKKIDEV
jgi:hypothetical protein